MESNDLLKSAEGGLHRVGKKELINHLKGERLTRKAAIRAKCYDYGMGESNKCDIETCPLHSYSPYKISRK